MSQGQTAGFHQAAQDQIRNQPSETVGEKVEVLIRVAMK